MAAQAECKEESYSISPNSIGPAKIGMTGRELRKLLPEYYLFRGEEFSPKEYGCTVYDSRTQKKLFAIVGAFDGMPTDCNFFIERIIVMSPKIKTSAGIGPTSLLTHATAVYGKATITKSVGRGPEYAEFVNFGMPSVRFRTNYCGIYADKDWSKVADKVGDNCVINFLEIVPQSKSGGYRNPPIAKKSETIASDPDPVLGLLNIYSSEFERTRVAYHDLGIIPSGPLVKQRLVVGEFITEVADEYIDDFWLQKDAIPHFYFFASLDNQEFTLLNENPRDKQLSAVINRLKVKKIKDTETTVKKILLLDKHLLKLKSFCESIDRCAHLPSPLISTAGAKAYGQADTVNDLVVEFNDGTKLLYQYLEPIGNNCGQVGSNKIVSEEFMSAAKRATTEILARLGKKNPFKLENGEYLEESESIIKFAKDAFGRYYKIYVAGDGC